MDRYYRKVDRKMKLLLGKKEKAEDKIEVELNENSTEEIKEEQKKSKKEKFNDWIHYYNHKYLKCVLIEAVALNYIIEAISRHSIFKPFVYLIKSPVMFVYNALLLLLVLGIGVLFRRRVLYGGLATILIMALGITNGVLLCFRTTPFAAVDLLLIKDALRIAKLYLPMFVIVMFAVLIVVVIISIVIIGFKMPKYDGKMHHLPTICLVSVYILSIVGIDSILVKIGVSAANYSNIANAYLNYGLPYCFSNSVFKLGMEEPEDYSDERMEEILQDTLGENNDRQDNGVGSDSNENQAENNQNAGGDSEVIKPNLVFVQLESFFDVQEVKGLEMSADPVPNFRYLKENFPSGYLYVPSIGAGTANTEFEIITGMNMEFFGPGEYPYKTILKETTCESMAYILSAQGYKTHAIHNNDGTFYDRHIVFSQLGFDTFTSMEYMYDAQYNVNDFMKDEILVKEIMDTLKSTEERDYVMSITVQSHGEYPSERLGEPQPIFIRYEDEEIENEWSYYVNQLYEVDQVIGELIEEVYAFDEPTVVVLFGDHLPNLGLSSKDVVSGRLTATEYVVWSNFEKQAEDKNLESYQLAAHVLKMMDMDGGYIMALHQNAMDDEDYMDKLEFLQYDMLYGERMVYDGVNPYEASDLVMGIRPIEINSVTTEENGKVYVRGTYFNDFSVVIRDGERLDTEYVDQNTLLVPGISLKDGDEFTVAQIGEDKYILSQTPVYLYETQY